MTGIPNSLLVPTPGIGQGWAKVARALADAIDPKDIEGIWLFPPVRKEDREWGVAVVACSAADERRRILTGSYMLVVRGREKGHHKVSVEEVGESPATVLEDVLKGVQARTGEMDPPVEIKPDVWYQESPEEDTNEEDSSVEETSGE